MTAEEILDKLVALRGQHDQTMRTQIIKLCFPATKDQNETERFLEFMIDEVQSSLNGIATKRDWNNR
jgi:hypothetical protein